MYRTEQLFDLLSAEPASFLNCCLPASSCVLVALSSMALLDGTIVIGTLRYTRGHPSSPRATGSGWHLYISSTRCHDGLELEPAERSSREDAQT